MERNQLKLIGLMLNYSKKIFGGLFFIFYLSINYSQTINLKKFIKVNTLETKSPYFFNEFDCVFHFDSFIYFKRANSNNIILKYNNDLTFKDSIFLDFKNFKDEVSNLNLKGSKSNFILDENQLYLSIFNLIFVFKKDKINKNYQLTKRIIHPEKKSFGELSNISNNKYIFTVSEEQFKRNSMGGIIVNKISIKKGKIIKNLKLNDSLSGLFYYRKSNFNYFISNYNNIYVHQINKPLIYSINKDLKIQYKINLPIKFNTKTPFDMNFIHTKFNNSIKLFDSIQEISNSMDRFESINVNNINSLLFLQIKMNKDSFPSLFTYNHLSNLNEVLDNNFKMLYLRNFVTVHNNHIYIWHGFGNVNYLNNNLNQDEIMKLLYSQKLNIGVYIYEIK